MKKIIIAIIVSMFLGICIWYGVSSFNSNSNLDYDDVQDIVLELKELTINSGESYKIEDFISSCSSGCSYSYDDPSYEGLVDVGEYDIVIVAKDNDKEVKASTKLIILDNVSHDIEVGESVTDDSSDEKEDTTLNNQQKVEEKKEVTNNQSKVEEKKEVTNSSSNSVEEKKEVTNNSNDVPVSKEPEITKVDTISEVISNNTYKYGTTIINTTTITYDVYSDGSKKEVNRSTSISYDYSTFNGTTNDLKSEAAGLVSSNSSQINEVISYTNQFRSEVDVSELVYDYNLSLGASIRALEMGWADNFSHTRPDGRSCFTIYNDLGITAYMYGENIAWGYGSAKSVTLGWKNSSGHYANMINSGYTKIGVGLAVVNGNYYWVQLFS